MAQLEIAEHHLFKVGDVFEYHGQRYRVFARVKDEYGRSTLQSLSSSDLHHHLEDFYFYNSARRVPEEA